MILQGFKMLKLICAAGCTELARYIVFKETFVFFIFAIKDFFCDFLKFELKRVKQSERDPPT